MDWNAHRRECDTGFVEPICEGYQAWLWWLALQNRVSAWSSPITDLNFAYRVCLETCRYTLMPVKNLKTNYKWAPAPHANNQDANLYNNFTERTSIIPQPVELVRRERQKALEQNKVTLMRFNSISQISNHSELWESILERVFQIEESRKD